jgi:hypothetical protein
VADTGSPGSSSTPAAEASESAGTTEASGASESTGTTEASGASEDAESKTAPETGTGAATDQSPDSGPEPTAPTDLPGDDDRDVRLGRTVAIALLLAVPPGVGMAIGVGVAAGLPPAHPLVIGGGAGLTLAILTLVLRSVLAGSPDPDRR